MKKVLNLIKSNLLIVIVMVVLAMIAWRSLVRKHPAAVDSQPPTGSATSIEVDRGRDA